MHQLEEKKPGYRKNLKAAQPEGLQTVRAGESTQGNPTWPRINITLTFILC